MFYGECVAFCHLGPGKSYSVKAIRKRDGTFVTDPDSIARIMRSHWTDTFTKRGIDGERLQEWLADDATERVQQGTHYGGMASLRLRKKHIKKAIKRSNNSAPGPDGIPYKAWRVLRNRGVNVLFDVF